jgi:MOSC domain-containing protein YiiM
MSAEETRLSVIVHQMGQPELTGTVEAVCCGAAHGPFKPTRSAIRLLAGLGVEGDAHLGATVQHRSRVRRDPTRPNLRQVHLIHAELHDELAEAGFRVAAGRMGENITTSGVALLALPCGARLSIGQDALLELTGLRNPCNQLDQIQPGLMDAVLDRDTHGNIVRKAGVMAIVINGGVVRPGDCVRVELPVRPHQPLQPV